MNKINETYTSLSLLEEKRSRFYSYIFRVFKEEEVNKLIKKKNFKASHIVYAYKINEIEKAFNSKEPCYTADRPLLKALNIKKGSNLLVVIVRYYGGIKLGTGFLARLYFRAALNGLEIFLDQ